MTGPLGLLGDGPHRQVLTPKPDLSAQGIEAVRGGGNVSGNAPAADHRLILAQSGADQQPVGLRFGGGDVNGSGTETGLKNFDHRRPPAFSHPATSSAGTGSTRQWPTRSGTMNLVTSSVRFLSAAAAAKMSVRE